MTPNGNRAQGICSYEAGPYRGEFTSEYCHDPAFLAAVSRPEDIWAHPQAALVHDQRNRVGTLRIVLSSGPSREFFVKEFPSRGLVRLKSLFQPSKAARAWRGALALEANGLGTAAPAGFLEKRERGFVERSFFFASRIDGAEEVRGLFRSLPPTQLKPLLAGLANFLSRCHDRGLLHRDLSDGNVLVRRVGSGGMEFFLLDTNRLRSVGKLGGLRRSKNLIRLGVPADCQEFFLKAYYGDRPLPRASWLWYKMNKAIFASYINIKKKLRLRRIARFLRIQ